MASFSDIIKSNTPTLVDFYAEWCGPCKTMQPILKEFKSKIGSNAKVLKIDVDKNASVARAYKIQGVPTLILFKNGEIKWRQSGIVSSSDLLKIIKKHLN